MTEIHHLRTTQQQEFHNTEAEQQLLGAVLSNNDLFPMIGDLLLPEHFHDPVHRDIYKACQSRIMRGHLADPVTLKAVMAGHEGLAQIGGPAYLVRLVGFAISPRYIRDYAMMVIDAASRRALDRACQEAMEANFRGADTLECVSGLLGALQRLPEATGQASTMSLLKAAFVAVEQANEAYQGNRTFLKTGLDDLDAIIKGLGPGDYMLLGGASSMGKTSVAIEIATNVAKTGLGVVFVSREMSEAQLATRIAASESRMPYAGLRNAETMIEDDFRKWVEAFHKIGSLPVRIVPSHVRDMAAIHAAVIRARAELGEAGLGLVVVDYAQLIRGQGKTRFEQMTDVSIGLKSLAGLLQVPVIALVQIDRNIGERDDKRPQMTDIRESGQFENDADQVVFCFREEYYLKRGGPKPGRDGQITTDAVADWVAACDAAKNKMELIVRKNRHGGLGVATVGFHDATNRFWKIENQQDMGF
jgi:replicative DNA helicase